MVALPLGEPPSDRTHTLAWEGDLGVVRKAGGREGGREGGRGGGREGERSVEV